MPDDSLEPSEEDINRKYAVRYSDRLQRMASVNLEQLSKTSGWLTASLLGINGGGALATLNVVERLDHPFYPSLAFGFGILFTLLNAVLIQAVSVRSVPLYEDAITHSHRVEVGGIFDESIVKDLADRFSRVERWSIVAPLMGWIAGLSFFIGGFVLLDDLRMEAQPGITRCHALQNDMLSEKPKRADSRELFAALRCRATAVGKVYPPPSSGK